MTTDTVTPELSACDQADMIASLQRRLMIKGIIQAAQRSACRRHRIVLQMHEDRNDIDLLYLAELIWQRHFHDIVEVSEAFARARS